MSKRPVAKKGKKGGKKNPIVEEASDNLENEDEMNLMDQGNMGGIDQE